MTRTFFQLAAGAILALLYGFGTPDVAAQTDATPATKSGDKQSVPQGDAMLVLVRTTLLSFNDALKTGNFSIFRDLIAPSVREQNSALQLFKTYAHLIDRKLDLSAVAILEPKYSPAPLIDASGRLIVSGSYPGPKLTIKFSIAYELVARRWKIYGLNLTAEQGQPSDPAKPK